MSKIKHGLRTYWRLAITDGMFRKSPPKDAPASEQFIHFGKQLRGVIVLVGGKTAFFFAVATALFIAQKTVETIGGRNYDGMAPDKPQQFRHR